MDKKIINLEHGILNNEVKNVRHNLALIGDTHSTGSVYGWVQMIKMKERHWTKKTINTEHLILNNEVKNVRHNLALIGDTHSTGSVYGWVQMNKMKERHWTLDIGHWTLDIGQKK